jgi:saccharopepsin
LQLPQNLGYTTRIGIGSPPQVFNMQIDISSPDSYVRSACRTCYSNYHIYNHDSSFTYEADDRPTNLDFFVRRTEGFLSRDTIQLGALQIANQSFQEATHIPYRTTWDSPSLIDSIMGFAPSPQSAPLSPFLTATRAGLLTHNLFALRLRAPLELSIGATNPSLYTGPITWVPLTNLTSNDSTPPARWQTSLSSLRISGNVPGTRSASLHWPLHNYTAVFSTIVPYIALPSSVFREIANVLTGLGFLYNDLIGQSIDCSLRAALPDISIRLAGRDFTMSGYDYTYEWEVGTCVSVFMWVGALEGRKDGEEAREIILGSSFLRTFYSIFDLEGRRIGFAELAAAGEEL